MVLAREVTADRGRGGRLPGVARLAQIAQIAQIDVEAIPPGQQSTKTRTRSFAAARRLMSSDSSRRVFPVRYLARDI